MEGGLFHLKNSEVAGLNTNQLREKWRKEKAFLPLKCV